MKEDISKAVETLKDGGVILYPTDTIWGIGCDATNPDAVAKLNELKHRSINKSMIILLENPAMLYSYVEQIPEMAWDLVELTTKPLTIIYPKAKNLAPALIAADGSIGIRIVKHAFCQRLIQAFRKPIVSTSANITGKPFPKSFSEIDSEIVNGVDYIVPSIYDEGNPPIPSGIISLGTGGEVKVIRE